MAWQQREPWHYWNGSDLVVLGRSMVEYRFTLTHQHFVSPYQRVSHSCITTLDTDLREWDWISERSRALAAPRRQRLLAEMQQALLIGGTKLTIVQRRPKTVNIPPLDSTEAIAHHLAYLANIFRDMGEDKAADQAFYASIQYNASNPVTGDFRDLAKRTLQNIATDYREQLPDGELALLRTFLDGSTA